MRFSVAAHVDFEGNTGEPRGFVVDVNGNRIGSWYIDEGGHHSVDSVVLPQGR